MYIQKRDIHTNILLRFYIKSRHSDNYTVYYFKNARKIIVQLFRRITYSKRLRNILISMGTLFLLGPKIKWTSHKMHRSWYFHFQLWTTWSFSSVTKEGKSRSIRRKAPKSVLVRWDGKLIRSSLQIDDCGIAKGNKVKNCNMAASLYGNIMFEQTEQRNLLN